MAAHLQVRRGPYRERPENSTAQNAPVTISRTHAKLFFHPRLTSVLRALFYKEDAVALKRLSKSQPDWEPRALLTKSAASKHLRPSNLR